MSNIATGGKRKSAHEINMVEGPLLGKILLFALPLALTSFLQQLFTTADTMLSGQFLGGDALAGIGSIVPVVNMLLNLFIGLSVGTNVIVAVHLGRREEARASQAVHTALALALVSGVALIALGLPLARPILQVIGTPDEVMDDALGYLNVYYLAMPFIMLYNFESAVLRSKGDTTRPLLCLGAGSLLNVALDMASILLTDLGVSGVAASTVVSYALTAVLLTILLMREEGALQLDVHRVRFHRKPLTDMLKIGVPAGVQGMVFSVSNLVIQAGINGFGPDAMAGSAAALNYEFFTYFMTSAFASAAVTFTSQNFAVREYGRCRRVYGLAMACALVSSGLLSLLFVSQARFFVGLGATEEAAVQFGLTRMFLVEAFEWIAASYEVAAGALRGMRHSLAPTAIIIAGTVGFRLLYFFTAFALSPTYETLMTVYLFSWVLTGAAMLFAHARICKKAFA